MLLRHLSLLTFVVCLNAASKSTITFQDCLTFKEAIIPHESDINWHPFSICTKVVCTQSVNTTRRREYLAPDGSYKYHGLRACIGFVGSPNAKLAQDIANSLSSDEATLWQDCWDGIYTIDQVLKTVATVHLLLGRHLLQPHEPPSIWLPHSEDITQPIFAPTILHTAFDELYLDPLHEAHRKVMECYARDTVKKFQRVPYCVINQEMLTEFCAQEQIGTRISDTKKGS